MVQVQYVVAAIQNQWNISCNGKQYGPYSCQERAVKAAIDAARGSGRMGYNSHVIVQGKRNLFRTEWSYGKDAYPVDRSIN